MIRIEMAQGCDGVWRAWARLNKILLTQPLTYEKIVGECGGMPDWFVGEWVVIATHKERKRALRVAAKRLRRYET